VLTRQPVKSRKCMGGVKFGEMERDCMLGHGASATLRERYFLLSDPYRMHICSNCKRPATMDKTRTSLCHFCKTRKHVVQINIPYACKLLWQELHSMGISIYMNTKV
jgi:DNA-directed RNA polymerase beta subunit